MNARRPLLSPLASLCAILGLLVLSSSASAAITHKYKESIAGVSAAGLTTGPAGDEELELVAEKDALFVATPTGVQRFSSAQAVSPSVALPFSCVTSECQEYIKGNEIVGTPAGELGGVSSVAVDDATGEIFASTRTAVDIFSATGEYLSQITEVPVSSGAGVTGPFTGVAGLAIDQATGELYIAVEGEHPITGEGDVVDVFKAQAPGKTEFVSQLGDDVLNGNEGRQQTVAVAEGGLAEAGSVYVTDTVSETVDVFSSLGTLEATWKGEGTPSGSFAVANSGRSPFVGVDPVTGRVYVADNEHEVVDEFEASVSEEYLGRLTGAPSGSFQGLKAVALARVGGDLYVGTEVQTGPFSFEYSVIVYGPDLRIPEVLAEAPSAKTSTSATLNGRVTLAKETATCRFVWGTSATELSKVAPCEPTEVVEGTEGEVAVHAMLGGLTTGTTYYYKLQATNTEPGNGETNTGETESVVSFTTEGPQFVSGSLSVSDVASTSATFNASVNPNETSTGVFFQYGACVSLSVCATSGYEARTPVQAIGSGDAPVPVQAHVQGLQAGGAYHYRVVALDGVAPGEFDGLEVGTFTTQAAGVFGLIDSRGWEMVSPPQKQGALIQGPGAPWGLTQAADTGDAFTFLTNVPTEPGVAGYSNAQQVFSSRTPAGWVSRDLATPHNGPVSGSLESGQEYRFFSEDLSHGVLQPFGAFQPCTNTHGEKQPCLSEEASEQTAFLRDNTTGGYAPLVSAADDTSSPFQPFGQAGVKEGGLCPPEKFCGPFFDGATADASHVVLSSLPGVALTGEPAPEGGLYEWSRPAPAGERLQLVSVLPAREGKPEEPYLSRASLGTRVTAGGREGDGADARHAISNDGSRVFWTGEDNTLYMRDMVKHETIQIGGSELGGPGEGGFQLASSDGSRVFYTELGSLYECEVVEEAGRLVCGPSGEATRLGEAPEGTGSVIGSSVDGSYVYWVSAKHDLYEDRLVGGEWRLRMIAALSGEDGPDWAVNGGELTHLTARVSPDGRWLAFMSDRQLTGYDNLDANSGKPDEEVFLYDAESGRLACASCDPTGARPVGADSQSANVSLVDEYDYQGWNGQEGAGSSTWLSADLPGWVAFEKSTATVSRYQPRYLSDAGRLYFNSYDALVPKDTNENWDVYEYEPEGVPAGAEHACTSSSTSGSVVYKPAHSFEVQGVQGEEGAGCLGLISSGESGQESDLLDASESGGDVFFMTTAKLAPQDSDQAYDVYDAHECTAASLCIAPPAGPPPACTTADACRAAPAPQPAIFGAPSSATFSGPGNLTPPPPAVVKPKTAEQIRIEKLDRALKACRKKRAGHGRAVCERKAHKTYAKKASAKKSTRRGRR
jgi:hypothetical protein